MNTVLGLISMILVYVMFIQFRVVNETDTEGIEFMRETELKETLANYKTNYTEIEEELQEIQKRIDEYRQNEESEETTISLLESEIIDANMKLGKTNVTGEGITITMTDREDYEARIF